MPWPPPTRATLVAPAVLLLAVAVPAQAQEFGQWWWQGGLSLGYRSYQNERGDEALTDYEQQEVEVELDVNGYVIHPAVGSFTLGLDVILSQLDGTETVDTDRYGAHGSLQLLERGKYPLRLFFNRQTFDYSDLPTDDPFTLLGAPETLTRWGLRGRLRTGFFQGSLYGVEHTAYDLLESSQGEDVSDSQFYDWSRTFGDIRQRVRVERRTRRFGVVDLSYEDLLLNLEEGGQIGESWQWDLNGSGVRRDLDLRDGTRRSFDTYFLRNRFLRPVGERDMLDIRHSHGFTSSDNLSDDRHSLSLFYRWHPRPGWEIGPFAEYSVRSAGDLELASPRAGVVVAWNRTWKAASAFVSAQASHSTLARDDNGVSMDETRTAYALTGSLTHRATEHLHEELEVEVTRNELQISPGPLLDLPDLGLGVGGLGTESKDRVRLTVERNGGARSSRLYGEWSERRSDDMLNAAGFKLETVTGNLALSGSRWSLAAQAGETDLSRAVGTTERLEFVSGSASLRPLRTLRLRATYRRDTRLLELFPDVDSEQIEVELDLQVGQLVLEARVFERLQGSNTFEDRTSRGVIVSLTRRLGGWLPVVSGDGRRGTIR